MKRELLIITLLALLVWRESTNHQKIGELENKLQVANQAENISVDPLSEKKSNSNMKISPQTSSLKLDLPDYGVVRDDQIEESSSSPKNESSRSGNRSEREVQFRSRFALANIERFVVLPTGKKEKVSELIAESMQRAENNESGIAEYYQSNLKAILGEDTYLSLQEAEAEEQARRQQERLESEVFRYARKLDLTATQEQAMSNIIQEGRDLFMPNNHNWRSDMMFLNSRERQDRMTEFFTARRSMQEYVTDTMQTVLNDEQYNSYLELENANRNSFHEQMLLNQNQQKKEQQ